MQSGKSVWLAVVGVACLLAGCSGSSGSAAPTPIVASRPIPANSPLAPCVDPTPTKPKPLDTDLAKHFADGRVTSTFSLDGGSFRATPPTRTTAPRIGEEQAFCNLLAGATSGNFRAIDAAGQHGMSFGLGVVTVDGSVGSGPVVQGQSLGGSTDETTTTTSTVPPKPYRARLAWIAVLRPEVFSSCPIQPAGNGMGQPPTTKAVKRLPGYQILVVDADTGADGLLYGAEADFPCGEPGVAPATASPAKVFVSVPWTLDSRGPGLKAATITYEPRPCDARDLGIFVPAGEPAVLADRDHPGLVRVELQRTLETCGPAESVPLLLRSATLATDLPAHLVHTPVGAMDTRG